MSEVMNEGSLLKASDEELLDAAQQGDRRATEALLIRHQDRIYRFGMRLCANVGDAEDVTQETLLAMAQSLPSFERRSSLSTWLYTIARSFCIKKRRQSKFAPSEIRPLYQITGAEPTLPEPGQTAPDDALARRELGTALERAIAALDVEQREVLVLRDVEGLSAAEVAEVLGVSVSAVKSRLHRARLKVRETLAPLLEPREVLAPAAAQCPDVLSMYSQHLEGDIDAELCRRLESHVATCAHCRSQCDSLKQTLALCGSAADARVPAEVQESVRRALRDFLAARPAAGTGPD